MKKKKTRKLKQKIGAICFKFRTAGTKTSRAVIGLDIDHL